MDIPFATEVSHFFYQSAITPGTLRASGKREDAAMRSMFFLTSAALLSTFLTVPSARPAEHASDEVVALTRAALDRWGKGDVQRLLSLYASEITYFDPFQKHRVDGIEAMRKLYAALAGKVQIRRYEMIDPRVQRYGNTAVLTFNLVDEPDEPGNVSVPWNCTQVYVRIHGEWRIVSEHWSFIRPEPKTVPANVR